MRIELTTDYAIHTRTLPEGSQLRVSNKLGKELIDLKVAKALDGFTFEEQIEHIVEVAMDNEEKPKVKKVTKKKKSNN
jgi:hypothetical protein